MDGERAETVIEICPQPFFRERATQVVAAGRQNTNIHFDWFVVVGANESLVLQHLEEPRLQCQRHLRDLIEKERALFTDFELAQARPTGTCRRPVRGGMLSAEKLDLQQVSRHLRTIDSQEFKPGVDRQLVDQTGDRTFSASGLSYNEYRNVRLGQQLRLRAELLHDGTDTEEELILA